MGDSDDDLASDRRDRGRRDKFRRERSDYQEPARGRREEWPDDSRGGGGGWGANRNSAGGGRDRNRGQDNFGRDNYGGGGQRRERYSPGDRSEGDPPMKRMRRDWDDRGYGGGGGYGDSYGGGGHGGSWGGPPDSGYGYHGGGGGPGHGRGERENAGTGGGGDNFPTQPPVVTFKQFLAGLDDSVGETDAVTKYNDYKTNFKKEQILEFFAKHKEEEWFRSKYHPDECDKGKKAKADAVILRLKIFNELLEQSLIDAVSIDVEKNIQIIRLLDAAVIKLEGGSDLDLESLDINFEESNKPLEPALSLFTVETDSSTAKKEDSDSNAQNLSPSKSKISTEDGALSQDSDVENGEAKHEAKTENTDGEPKAEEDMNGVAVTSEPVDDVKKEVADDSDSKPDIEVKDELTTETPTEEPVLAPRHLHKTLSVFLRNIAPTVSRKEIEEECKKITGYMRLAIADPQPERRFYRRGWVTFDRTVNIRDICWNLNAIKFGGVETGAIINRDLSRRIRSVNGIASHKNVIRADIRHAAKIVFNLDQQKKLWQSDSANTDEPAPVKEGGGRPAFGFESKNPLLRNITDYLIEEASAEEEELLGAEVGELEDGEAEENAGAGTGTGQSLERDDKLIKVLDHLLVYLRIVHSIDYYNHSDYPQEDEMPNRIGIMHARGSPPSSKITNQEVNEYLKTFEGKIQPYLQPPPVITEEEAAKLGKQNPDIEVEKFIEKNTEFLAQGKYYCPLSKKKFKGPEFVKKHIENKFAENIEAIRNDTFYFNNFLLDPKRPQLPEHPSNRPQQPTQAPQGGREGPGMGGPGGPWPPHQMGPYGPPHPYLGYGGPHRGGAPMAGFGAPMGGWGNGPGRGGFPMGGPFGGRGGRGRRNYRDWDAPEED